MRLHYGDLTDSTNLVKIIAEVKPNEVYNLAAQSHVKVSKTNNQRDPTRYTTRLNYVKVSTTNNQRDPTRSTTLLPRVRSK